MSPDIYTNKLNQEAKWNETNICDDTTRRPEREKKATLNERLSRESLSTLTLASATVGPELKTTMTLAGIRTEFVAADVGASCCAFGTLVDV